jgi:hypothetical protein
VNGLRKQLLAQGCCPGPQHISCRSWP